VTARADGAMSDLARGCATKHLAEDSTSVTIDVALVPGREVTPTKCATLSEHCAGQCQ
jgi:hypothetical protein